MPKKANQINNGVMLNAYPDSIGQNLSDTVKMLRLPEFKDTFSLFYILPTFFNSDLDRGFSIIDYDINEELVAKKDIAALKELNIQLKFDIVLNHLSVGSPQFQDLIKNGSQSKFKDFFINWNEFWEGQGTPNEAGVIIPKKEFLDRLFMRKSGLPILKVLFSRRFRTTLLEYFLSKNYLFKNHRKRFKCYPQFKSEECGIPLQKGQSSY